MSKLSFRARAVDASKQMPVFLAEELPDLSEYASINRSVPQMPTGMEKDEEMELHLQQAISAQQRSSTGGVVPTDDAIIPIPKVSSDVSYYERLYPTDYKLPKQLIKVQAALNLEPEIPDYDLDSEDERWLSTHGPKMDISPLQFERIMDTLEKQSEFKVITPPEAKLLLQEDDDMLLSVYDYWLTKRYAAASQGKNLIPRVKTEKRDGTGAKHNPYVAFRRRAEKMQTRKNRRNDEESYEKILKLRHDLQKAVTLAEMVKRREKSKRELINLTLDVVEKRFLGDIGEELFLRICNEAKPAFKFSKHETGPLVTSNNNKKPPVSPRKRNGLVGQAKEDKGLASREWLIQNAEEWNQPPASFLSSPSSSATTSSVTLPCELDRTGEEPDGRYSFKRIRGCRYYAPSSPCNNNATTTPWPWEGPRRHATYFPTYLRSRHHNTAACSSVERVNGLKFVGVARRRLGRGGRILLDRRRCPVDDRSMHGREVFPSTSSGITNQDEIVDGRLYFRPSGSSTELDIDEYESLASTAESGGGSSGGGTRQTVSFATVVGPNGALRLPMTIGSIVTPDCDRISRSSSGGGDTTVEREYSVQTQLNSSSEVDRNVGATYLVSRLNQSPGNDASSWLPPSPHVANRKICTMSYTCHKLPPHSSVTC